MSASHESSNTDDFLRINSSDFDNPWFKDCCCNMDIQSSGSSHQSFVGPLWLPDGAQYLSDGKIVLPVEANLSLNIYELRKKKYSIKIVTRNKRNRKEIAKWYA